MCQRAAGPIGLYESNVIKYVMTDISSQIGVSRHSSKNKNEMCESNVRYTIHFCKINNRGVGEGEDKVIWYGKKEKMKFKVLDLFIFAIRRYSHAHGFTNEFKVTGYTTFKVYINASDNPVKYYASAYMNGWKRSDYAMIEFVSDDGTIAKCPAMILGFVWYNITLGISTPQFTDEEELSLTTIQENMAVDNNLYVVVHTASDYVSVDQLEKEFMSSFTLENIMNCVYIFKVEKIHWPLFGFMNYGSSGENATKLFCTLPEKKWGKYFSGKIDS
jgi:hypothetical protein